MTKFLQQVAIVVLSLVVLACGSKGDEQNSAASEQSRCTSTAECPDSGVCRDGVCVVAQKCSKSEDCGASRLCDEESKLCVECVSGSDCSKGETCLANVCRSPCDSSTECGNGLSCSAEGYCVECLNDAGCGADEYCSQGSCMADICSARTTSCENDGNVVVCSDRGDTYLKLECPPGESCFGTFGDAWCEGWSCVPDQSTCSEDGEAMLCSADGHGYASVEDCAESDAICIDGECKPSICKQYQLNCQDGDVYQCNSTGTDWNIVDVCGSTEFCDDSINACTPQVCTPETQGCSSVSEVGTCNAEGSGFESPEACPKDQACQFGSCAPIVCEAGSSYCSGNSIYECNDSGTGASLFSTCYTSQYCQEFDGSAYCAADKCSANSLSCDGNTAGTCKADGSGLDPLTAVDCTEAGEMCYGGSCLPQVCTVGTRLCQNGNVRSCINNGTATSAWDTCTSSEYCDDSTATCKTKLCTPDVPGCDGNIATECNALGSGWESGGTDCSALTDKACDAGTCADVICEPNSTFCDGTTVRRCSANGTSSSLYTSCGSSYHCYQSSDTTASCRYDLCTNGAKYCSGSNALTCAADGSGPVSSTDCSETGQNCMAGVCKDVVCAGYYECVGGNLYNCLDNGTRTTLRDTCTASEYCDDLYSSCRPQVCTPNAVTCFGSTAISTCNAEGSAKTITSCQSGDVCWNGTCQPKICTNGEKLCLGGDYHLCDKNGAGSTLLNDCLEAQYCDSATGCQADKCTANEPVCNGSLITTCASDGSGPVPGGTDCSASGEVCFEATCHPKVCEADTYSCSGNELSQCMDSGSRSEVIDTCETGTHCDAETGMCAFDICTTGEAVCIDAHTLASCATTKDSYVLPGTTCGASDVCLDGACVADTTSCDLLSKAWTTPVAIPGQYGAPSAAGADARDNIFFLTNRSVRRYDADAAEWTELVLHTSLLAAQALAVSPDGHAVVTYAIDTVGTVDVFARVYDPQTKTWGAAEKLHTEIFAQIRLATRMSISGHAVILVSSDMELTLFDYDPSYGWESGFERISAETFRKFDLDMTADGHALFVWSSESPIKGIWWTTRQPNTSGWATPQLLASWDYSYNSSSQDMLSAMFLDQQANSFGAFYIDDTTDELLTGLFSGWYSDWTSTEGVKNVTELTDVSVYGTFHLLALPDKSMLAVTGTESKLRDPDTLQWSTEQAVTANGGIFALATGEVISVNDHTGSYRSKAGVWSSMGVTYTRNNSKLVPLSGCEVAVLYSSSSVNYISYRR